MQRIASIAFAILLGSLFSVAFWFRVTSLESMPSPDGDEAWYGVQAHRFLTGRPFEAFTPYANPLNPFFSGLHLPALLALTPALWHLRVPAALCGILAVVGTYVLGCRVLDRTTALIASALLAVLPVAIVFSRYGYDASQTPLFTLLALYFAFRAHRVGVVLAFLASYIVHPTNVFALPAVLCVFLAQELRKAPGDRARQARVAVATLVGPTAFALVVGYLTLRRPQLRAMFREGGGQALGHHDVLRTLTMWRRLLLGIPIDPSASSAASRLNDGLFWVPLLGLFALGMRRLVLDRRWDRVALVAGTFASAGGFFVVAGSDAIPPLWAAFLRYGLFLVIPAVLATACVARSLLIEPTSPPRALARRLQDAGLLALGAALLFGAKWNWFDPFTRDGVESVWTLKTDVKSAFHQASSAIRHDLALRRPATDRVTTIITENHWIQRPMEYLCSPRPDLQVVAYDVWEGWDRARHQQLLREHMESGGFAVCHAGRDLENDLKAAFPPERLRRWDLVARDGPVIVVYRLKPAPAVAGSPAASLPDSPRR
jgi:4-amino-4-deoxy-L-arabinose transferase-like glycosyltransferase